MKKKITAAVVAVLIILAVLGGVKVLQIRKMMAAGASMTIPPETVTSVEVRSEKWQPSLFAIGSISPVQGVVISSELAGTVKEIAFESGAMVKEGDLLAQLDVAAEEAQLRSGQAAAELARVESDRARDLQSRKVIAKSELDTAQAKYDQALAQVDNLKSIIAKKTIRAPFSGRLGIREVNPGQFVNAGQRIVPLQALETLYADFSLPQQDIGSLTVGMPVNVTSDSFPGKTFAGRLTAINSELDSATRSVLLQTTLKNEGELLHSGMFVKVDVLLPQQNDVLVIPSTAVSYAPYGDSVFVIEDTKDEKTGQTFLGIRQQFVRLGKARGDYVAVISGVKAGEKVVSTGIFKLRNKMAVVVDNTLAPASQISPTPADT